MRGVSSEGTRRQRSTMDLSLPPERPVRAAVWHAHFFWRERQREGRWGIAAGGNGDGNVAGAAKGFDLAGEDAAEAVVIGDSGDGGKICGQGERGKSGAIKGEAANEFRGDVLGVRGAAAITE